MTLIFSIIAILFFATFIRSTFGFGEALIAVPLLALLIPINIAAPVAVLVSITVAAIIVIQDWNYIHFRSAGWLVLSSVFGIPLGILLLMKFPEQVIKSILAVVIISFSAYSLSGWKRISLSNDKHAWGFGILAGILGGTYGMNGPPLVIYGVLRNWSPRYFRATLQGYFLPASILIMIGYGFTGLWTPTVTDYYLMALPAVLLATLWGRWINRRMKNATFLQYIHIGLILIGLILLIQSCI